MRMLYTLGYAHLRSDLWLNMEPVHAMIVFSNYLSRRGNLRERAMPFQPKSLTIDSGGFYFHLRGMEYPLSYDDYVSFGNKMSPQYMVCWDYPCEAELALDDIAVLYRQARTLDHARSLLAYTVPWTWIPVIQGRTVSQYVRHAEMYKDAGIVQPYMAIGSLCRRTHVSEITSIIEAIHDALPATRFHLFGVKSQIFRFWRVPSWVDSADTGAWGGMFGRDREVWKEAQRRGLTQAQFEVREALPRYRHKIDGWLNCG